MYEAQDRSSGTVVLISAMEARELEIGQCYSLEEQDPAESCKSRAPSSPDLSYLTS